jgi:hypothetical protein
MVESLSLDLVRGLQVPAGMNSCRVVVMCGLTALAVFQARAAFADDGRCFDFATPTADKLLIADKVQRIVIQVENADREAGQAAAAVAREAKKHGIEAVFSNQTWPATGASAEEHAAQVCKDNSAQLVASVHFLTGSNPKAASVGFRDASGQSVGSMTSWMTEGLSCPESPPGLEVAVPQDMSTTTWYGWQLMLADVGAFSMLLARQGWPYLVTYTLFPAALHGANGQGGRAFRSIGLRSIPILVAGGVYLLATACREGKADWETCNDGVTPFLVTAILVSIVDDFAFAWKPTEVAPTATERRPVGKTQSVSLGVGLLPSRNGASLAFSGRF